MPFFDDFMVAMKNPIDAQKRASSAVVASLKGKAQAWARDVVALYNMRVPSDLEPKKRALLTRANTIRKTIETIFGALPEFKNMQLAALPLVVGFVSVAAVTAGLAAITYWTTDYGKLKLDVQRRAEQDKHVRDLVASGVPIADARASVAKDESKSLFERFIGDPQKIILPAVGLSIAGYFIYKYFLSKKR